MKKGERRGEKRRSETLRYEISSIYKSWFPRKPCVNTFHNVGVRGEEGSGGEGRRGEERGGEGRGEERRGEERRGKERRVEER